MPIKGPARGWAGCNDETLRVVQRRYGGSGPAAIRWSRTDSGGGVSVANELNVLWLRFCI